MLDGGLSDTPEKEITVRRIVTHLMKGAGIMLLVFGRFKALLAEGLQLSGGVDARFTHQNHPQNDDAELHGVFLNLRQVWSDDTGDRWIAVAQADFDRNFEDIRPYQLYLQYKGPLGKWNVRAGHYLLPFGLLANYDTERFLLRGLEETNLGIRKDTGAQVFGHFGEWDYAVSVSDGLSDIRFADSRANPVLTARLAYVKDDWQLGVSTFVGRPWARFEPLVGDEETSARFTQQRRVALDAIKFWGPVTVRAEVSGGSDDGRGVCGGVLLADYTILQKLELNSRFAYWHRDGDNQSVGLGLSYNVWRGLFLRVADNYEFGKREKNELTAQVYFEFSHRF